MSFNGLRLGIDTGGTYTDAVLFTTQGEPRSPTGPDAAWGVLKAAKSLTTRQDLFQGIMASTSKVLEDQDSKSIELVSLSTTLATNAIVEGLRPPVALVLIGFDEKALSRGNLGKALQDDPVIFLSGGHCADGSPLGKLDLSPLKQALDEDDTTVRGLSQVEAVAIVGKFAVRNREHEMAVKAFLDEALAVPVTCSYELSEQLNGPLRAVTTLFNARLLPHLADLTRSTQSMLSQKGIEAPLMIVQGDGSMVSADDAVERPIETVLSGPAASLVGAWHLALSQGKVAKANKADREVGEKGQSAARNRLCVSDMGGTTTDIGFLEEGRPKLADEGATVDGFRTHVRAVDMQTWGLGGDSEIAIKGATLSVGPRRAEPLCVAADTYPQLIGLLQGQLEDLRPDLGNARFLRRFRSIEVQGLSKVEQSVWDAMADGPLAVRDIERAYTGSAALQSLLRRGLALLIAFTPTDAAHVLGLQSTNKLEASRLGADLMRVPKDMEGWLGFDEAKLFAAHVVERCQQEVTAVHLKSALMADGINPKELGPTLLNDLMCDQARPSQRFSSAYTMPLIGVGAPAKLYYPEAARRIKADFYDLKHADVCNAVGAVATGIIRRASILITSPAENTYRLHLPEGAIDIADDLSIARTHAVEVAKEAACQAAVVAGAQDPEIEVFWQDKIIDMVGKTTFLEARVTVEATGAPLTKSAA